MFLNFSGQMFPISHSNDPVSLKMTICSWQTASMVHIIHYQSVANNNDHVLGSTNFCHLSRSFYRTL